MIASPFHRILITRSDKIPPAHFWFWLGFSLLFAGVCGGLALSYGFRGEYIVDSDARQHVFWMQRFADPGLFPNDLITDYHQSVAPPGYTLFYRIFDSLGIQPFVLNKLLPPLLGLVATGYCFFTTLELLPLPVAGFASTLLLNQALWLRYDLVSGTPRSFVYPLFLAFLYYLLRRRVLPCLAAIALQGLFYPQILFVSAAILVLQPFHWRQGRVQVGRDRRELVLCLMGLGVAVLVMLPYALQSSEFGPAIAAAQARQSPEFLPGGRTPFFHTNPWEFWLYGKRSGVLPDADSMPPLIWVGLLLPVVMVGRFPLIAQMTSQVGILGRSLLASLGMFLIAHALLFRLHLPSRYTMHSLPVLLALAAGITLTVLLDGLFHWAQRWGRQRVASGVAIVLGIVLVLYPAVTGFPYTKYRRGEAPQLYTFLANQPKDTLVASLAKEANNIPTFAGRSVLVSEMFAIPYQVGYYRQIRQRTEAVIRAQYSSDPAELQRVIRQYGIDFWLLDDHAFTPEYLAQNNWLTQFPVTQTAIAQLQRGELPVLGKGDDRCVVLKTEGLRLLDAQCLQTGF